MKLDTGIVNNGKVISCEKIAGNTWHLKIEASALPGFEADKIPGYLLPVLISGNAEGDTVVRRFVIWNYVPKLHLIDLAITPSAEDTYLPWLNKVKSGDVVRFFEPEELVKLADSADNYFLIGDVQSLAFYYQLNRNLPFLNQVKCLIYSPTTGGFFPDLDNSYPFDYQVIYPYSPERVLDYFKENFEIEPGSLVIYLSGSTEVNKLFIAFLKDQWRIKENQVKVATFNNEAINLF